jgi:WD40 repeat protein/serine/threonine protein kinase
MGGDCKGAMAMKEEPKDIKIIFSEALEKKTPQERAAYLERACGDDTNLRAKVEDLLKAHEEAGSFLDAPPFDPNVTLNTSPLTEGPGTIIGRYKLLEQIGEGGFGVVYMAEQQEPIRRRVALKIIKLGMDTKQVIARFEAERQALAMMDHPNIAGVLDAGATETGRPYFVMELVKGIPITEYCDKNNLDTQQRLELFIDVCKAVQHAHQKGIIHRDIKPSNVMITLHDGKPVPKVIDFGIAKATSHRLTEKTLFTKYAQMIGTPEYMSPEQAEMSCLDIDTRTDIYSLGVLLYELLTSATPFDAKELREAGYIQMQRIIRETEPLKPSTKLSTMGDALTDIAKHRDVQPGELCKIVRGDLDWVVMKTIEKDRTRRYETANELAMDIQRHLSNEPVEASPPSTLYRFRKLVQKHRRTVAAVITIAATLIIGLVVSSTMYFVANRARWSEAVARTQAEQAKVIAEQAEKVAQEQKNIAETKAEDLRRAMYANSIQLADAKYKEGNIKRVHELLDSCPNDLRGWEWNRLNHIMDQSSVTLRGHEDEIWCLALSPDGKQVASGDVNGIIKLWNWETGIELKTFHRHTDYVTSLAFSPDGSRLASGSGDQVIKIWDISKGQEVMTLRGHSWINSVAFSPDNKFIASAGDDAQVRIWDISKGEEVITFGGEQGEVRSVVFNPDGKRIASGNSDKTVTIWDASSGKKLMTLSGHKETVNSVKFTPDGKYIASGSWDGTVKVWNASTGEEKMTLRGHTKSVVSVAFDWNGKYIVSCSNDNTIKIWDVSTGEELITLRGHCDSVDSALFSLDGKKIISGGPDKTLKVWDIGTCSEQIAMRISRTLTGFIAFSQDSKRIASEDIRGAGIEVWDAEIGKELMTLYGHRGVVKQVVFSPDGNRMASGSRDNTIKVWDAPTGKVLMTFHGHKEEVFSLAFSPDGKRIVSGSLDKTIKVWDISTKTELMTLLGHKDWVYSVAFSPDGKRIISGSKDETIKIWDVSKRIELMTLQHKLGTWSVAFSPDGNHIVSAGGGVIKIWDAETGCELMTLSGHLGLVSSVSFSPDGKRLVSGGMNGDVKVWDAITGSELITLNEFSAVYSVAFSPDGHSLAAGGYGGIVVWETTKPAVGYGPRKNAQAAQKIVDELYEKYGYYYKVIDKLQTDKSLDEPVRQLALQIAHSHLRYELVKIRYESARVVTSPGKNIEEYRVALENVEKAFSFEPNEPNAVGILTTLGVGQYRVGNYEDALDMLTKADQMVASAKIESPFAVVFTAMTLHKLGRNEEAKVALERFRTLLKAEWMASFAQREEAKACLAEAEKLIEGEK